MDDRKGDEFLLVPTDSLHSTNSLHSPSRTYNQ